MQQLEKPRKGYKLVKSLFGKYEEIPEDWNVERLGNISELFVPMRDKPKKFDGDIPWLRIEDLDGKFASDSKSNQRVSKAIVQQMNLRIYPIGTVLCSCSATIGVCAITTKELITNQTFIGIYPKLQLNKEFLYYYFLTQENNLRKIGSGSTILYISREKFEIFPIILPPQREQQKIASILSNVDSLIQQTQKEIEQTQRLKKGLMQKLLTKGIGHTKFKKIPFVFQRELEIPDSWHFNTIREISEKLVVGFVGTCDPFYTDSGIPMLRTTNVSEGKLILSNLKYVTKEFHEKNKKSQVKRNDLLVSRHGENGEACLVRDLNEANCLNIVIIRAKKEVMIPDFFELMFNFNTIRLQIKRTTAGGVQGVVNTGEIGDVKIPIPSITEQQKLASILSNVESEINKLQEYKSKLETLKKGLMQKLLTGQIRVKV